MTVRVGINGFGRIGRNFLRAVRSTDADIEIVGVNDVTDAENLGILLKFDSVHGRYPGDVVAEGDHLLVDGRKIVVLSERDPAELPWGELGATVVVESTGKFTLRADAAKHLEGGAERVVVSAPSKDADLTVVMGVNDDKFDPALHRVVSNASCTTNCFVPMVRVLDDAFGVEKGFLTTAHAMTNDQNLLDLPHRDVRKGRAAPLNIVPASTGAARATGKVLPDMQGRLDGFAIRVPVGDGSLTDFVAIVRASVGVEEVNAAFRAASDSGPLARFLEYSEDPLVSSDIIGDPSSCIFDSQLTMAMPVTDTTTLVKVEGWYDNEWGYSNRLVDVVQLVSGK